MYLLSHNSIKVECHLTLLLVPLLAGITFSFFPNLASAHSNIATKRTSIILPQNAEKPHALPKHSHSKPKNPSPVDTIEDLFKEFEGLDDKSTSKPGKTNRYTSTQVDGKLSSTVVYNVSPQADTVWEGFSMLRTELKAGLRTRLSDKWQVKIDIRGFYDLIYTIKDREQYTQHVIDTYERQLDVEESYIFGRLSPHVDLTIGRQIIVWGKLDDIRVNDSINPLDQRLPGLTDIEDLRRPVSMAKIDYSADNWSLSGVLIPEIRYSQRPAIGSDYSSAQNDMTFDKQPSEGFNDIQYAASLEAYQKGWDLGIYYANLYADQPCIEYISGNSFGYLIEKHSRIDRFGAAASLSAGNWILKAEMATIHGLQHSQAQGKKFDRFDMGAGFEYSGFRNSTISLEAVNRHILNLDQQLTSSPEKIHQDTFQSSWRITRSYLNDTLALTMRITMFGPMAQDGTIERIDVTYDIDDAISVRGGIILYQTENCGDFKYVEPNDRIFVTFTLRF